MRALLLLLFLALLAIAVGLPWSSGSRLEGPALVDGFVLGEAPGTGRSTLGVLALPEPTPGASPSRSEAGPLAGEGSSAVGTATQAQRFDLEILFTAPQRNKLKEKTPLAGIAVRLRQRDPELPELAAGFTDGNGVWRVSIPADRVAWNDKGWGSFVTELTEFGYRGRARLAVKRAGPREQALVLNVKAKWGHTFRLAVHRDLGRVGAAPFSTIRLRGASWRNPKSGRARTVAFTKLAYVKLGDESSPGRQVFKIDFSSAPGFWPAAIFVDGGAWGTAVLDLTELQHAPSGGEPTALWLRGPGVLKGRVLDSEGEPMEGVKVNVGRVIPPGTPEALEDQIRDELLLEGSGRIRGSARTARDGTFEIGGLCEADYALVAQGFVRVPSKPGAFDDRGSAGGPKGVVSKEVRASGTFRASDFGPELVIQPEETGVTQSFSRPCLLYTSPSPRD